MSSLNTLLFASLVFELLCASLEFFLGFRFLVLKDVSGDRQGIAGLTLEMISWIFSSCDSPSSTFLTCCNETFSLYPKLTTSSNAHKSSKDDARIEGSLSAGVRDVIRRTTRDRVWMS